MRSAAELLRRTAIARIAEGGYRAQCCFDEASDVIVFGSMAAGTNREDSDIDILCLGAAGLKIKTEALDLIVFPHTAIQSRIWIQSELIVHVRHYGVSIKGTSNWIEKAEVGPRAIAEKRRRVESFIRHLPSSWSALDGEFRVKYSVKVRREIQRLLLLNRRLPVPPTGLLDTRWAEFCISENELMETLFGFLKSTHGGFSKVFIRSVETSLHDSTLAAQRDLLPRSSSGYSARTMTA